MAEYSANTQYETFEICCTTSGATETHNVPHPIYSDAEGNTYEQLNAVKLGGVNGLNN
jgi:hypothetical protein